MSDGVVVILGIFAADLAFRAPRLPRIGETLMGEGFHLGPGGKGSNQAVAAARSGAQVRLITRIGADPFGDMARNLWTGEGIDIAHVALGEAPTGAAFIFVNSQTGDNAIIVESGAAAQLSPKDLDDVAKAFSSANVFMTQLEQPIPAAIRGLEIARETGVLTILNPAPATALPEMVWPLCDFVTPNESEAEALTGIAVSDLEAARRAGDVLLARGVGTAVLTLGAQGVLVHGREGSTLVPAVAAGPVLDTTGAGDAFGGGFAASLARGEDVLTAARFGCAVAGLSVTRPGTAASMPRLSEVRALMKA
jgi:ribokinase